MAIVIDVETCPIKISEIPKENYEYLVKKSENKRSGKIVDKNGYGGGAIGKPELNKIICCCTKINDKEIVSHIGEEKDIIKEVFGLLVNQDLIIGFNSNSFDLPLLKLRGIVNGLHTCSIRFGIKNWSERLIDVRYQLAGQYDVGDLSYWCRVFGIEPPEWDEDMDKSDLSKYPIEKVVENCITDVQCTYMLYQKLNNSLDKNN